MLRFIIVSLLLCTTVSHRVHAQTVLDFNSPPFNTCSFYEFGGFSFSNASCAGSWTDNPKSNNGTPGLLYGFAPLVMTQTNGQPFTLHSLFAGTSTFSDDGEFDIEYVFELTGGGQAVGSFTISEGLELYTSDQSITQATFGELPHGYIAMDDITVSTATVPEPSSSVLVVAGLLAIFVLRRRPVPIHGVVPMA